MRYVSHVAKHRQRNKDQESRRHATRKASSSGLVGSHRQDCDLEKALQPHTSLSLVSEARQLPRLQVCLIQPVPAVQDNDAFYDKELSAGSMLHEQPMSHLPWIRQMMDNCHDHSIIENITTTF